MALIDLWQSDRDQVFGKRLSQLIAFAGEGKLRDGSATSAELRSLLGVVPSDLISSWISECLDDRFTDFGLVLQDIVNEIGRRLNFKVTYGVYHSHADTSYDGHWTLCDGQTIIVESKSSTDYRIDLTRIAGYRSQLPPAVTQSPNDVSILIVVGSEDTTELEAQVRGSKYAWNVRLLGMTALIRLLQLKESLDDPAVERQIQEILIPQEFTRLDRIVDLVFSTVEDAQEQGFVGEDETSLESGSELRVRATPASFHAKIIPQLEANLGRALVKRSRIIWATADGETLVSCQVSKEHVGKAVQYWFGLKRSTKDTLQSSEAAYSAFGLGTPSCVVLMPFGVLLSHLDAMFTSPDQNGDIGHWHVRFSIDGDNVYLMTNRDRTRLDVSKYLLKS